MGTWCKITVRLDPWSYRNLLMKQAVLRATKPDISRAGTCRYIFRRLRFTREQKRAYAQMVNERIRANKPHAIDAVLDKQTLPD